MEAVLDGVSVIPAGASAAEGYGASLSQPLATVASVETHRDMTMKCGMQPIRAALRAQVAAQQRNDATSSSTAVQSDGQGEG